MATFKKPKLSQKRNLGVCWERAEYNLHDDGPNPEKAFQEVWDHENTPQSTSSRGIGQDIFIVSKNSADNFDGPNRDDIPYGDLWGNSVCVYRLSVREYRIIATFVQWLGTNCGFSFLHEALQRCGYSITKKPYYKQDTRKSKLDRYGILRARQHEDTERKKASKLLEPDPTRDGGKKNIAPLQTEMPLSSELCIRCPHSDRCKQNEKPGSDHCFDVLHHLV